MIRPLPFVHHDVGVGLKEASAIYKQLLDDLGEYAPRLNALSLLIDSVQGQVLRLLREEMAAQAFELQKASDATNESIMVPSEELLEEPEPEESPAPKAKNGTQASARKKQAQEISGIIEGIVQDRPHTTAEVKHNLQDIYHIKLTLAQVAGKLRHLREAGKVARRNDPDSRLDKWFSTVEPTPRPEAIVLGGQAC